MSVTQTTIAILVVGVSVQNLAAQDKAEPIPPALVDTFLRDEPITIVFRRIREHPLLGETWRWYWSINSAGEAEMSTENSQKSTRKKQSFSVEKMGAVRKTLHDERFMEFKEEYGPVYIHGGWSTLTVIVGDRINKTVRFNSTWGWDTPNQKKTLAEAAPAARVWLKVVEMVDPEATIFTERKDMAAALKALKK
jgi:hypothetical protein